MLTRRDLLAIESALRSYAHDCRVIQQHGGGVQMQYREREVRVTELANRLSRALRTDQLSELPLDSEESAA